MNEITPQRLFPAEKMEELRSRGHPVEYPPGSLLMREGDDSDFVLYLESGHVKISKHAPQTIVDLHGPGSTVGELAAITGEPRIADVIAVGQVKALLIPGGEWISLLHALPEIMFAVLRQTGLRLTHTAAKSGESRLTAEQKIATVLLKLREAGLGEKTAEGELFRNVSQRDLAALAAVSRETVNHVLSRFKQNASAVPGRARLLVRDWDAVRAVAELPLRTGER